MDEGDVNQNTIYSLFHCLLALKYYVLFNFSLKPKEFTINFKISINLNFMCILELFMTVFADTVDLRLRLQINLNLSPVSICVNFGLIVYFIETQNS